MSDTLCQGHVLLQRRAVARSTPVADMHGWKPGACDTPIHSSRGKEMLCTLHITC